MDDSNGDNKKEKQKEDIKMTSVSSSKGSRPVTPSKVKITTEGMPAVEVSL